MRIFDKYYNQNCIINIIQVYGKESNQLLKVEKSCQFVLRQWYSLGVCRVKSRKKEMKD